MHKPPHPPPPPPHTPLANQAAKQLEVKIDGRWCQRNKPSSIHHWKDKHVLSAVQRMAQAHLSSLDTSSLDREDLSSGGEEEETGQSRISNTGNTDTFSASGHLTLAFVLQTYILTPSHRNLFFFFLRSDLREESKLLRGQCASADTSTEKADPRCHQMDEQDAKEQEGETGD